MAWTAKWSGAYPNLCSGEWTLYHDGITVDTNIPFQGSDAGTFGTYPTWSFGSDWDEQWDEYDDGMLCGDWCQEYEYWLSHLAPREEWGEIYTAFQAEDWRHNSCGGCI